MNDFYTNTFSSAPVWQTDEVSETALPARADVVIIGSGYTGLSAALTTARGGRDVVVLEAGAVGMGCSTRNGAQSLPLRQAPHARDPRDKRLDPPSRSP